MLRAFDRSVLPLVERTVSDATLRHTIQRSFMGTSVKVGLAMWGYATMARVPFDAELTVLGSSFTRLYDDLIDHCEREGLDSDLTALFAGGTFRPRSPLEALLLLLHSTIAARLPHSAGDPIHSLIRELHTFQLRSRAQRGSHISAAEVLDITRGKGGLGMAALFALLRPGMSEAERDILVELGEVFQLLDDFHDLPLDRVNGITTSATLGVLSLSDLATRIARLQTCCAEYYGSAAPLSAQLALTLIGAPVAARDRRRRDSPNPKTDPLHLLLSRAGNIRP
ncbi:class 1 isoprenoid biosynthesis enzyme [Streptomyces sp. NPDC050423]|uniref:class 1 isoprenoid biosynthesis enzyme n=1 Tax=Streptomyces sp. NPDC050423 TaxID=3155402 RepID=UPI0034439EB0